MAALGISALWNVGSGCMMAVQSTVGSSSSAAGFSERRSRRKTIAKKFGVSRRTAILKRHLAIVTTIWNCLTRTSPSFTSLSVFSWTGVLLADSATLVEFWRHLRRVHRLMRLRVRYRYETYIYSFFLFLCVLFSWVVSTIISLLCCPNMRWNQNYITCLKLRLGQRCRKRSTAVTWIPSIESWGDCNVKIPFTLRTCWRSNRNVSEGSDGKQIYTLLLLRCRSHTSLCRQSCSLIFVSVKYVVMLSDVCFVAVAVFQSNSLRDMWPEKKTRLQIRWL